MVNTIQCIKRIYRIQTSTGVKMDIESDEPLSGAATAKLLEEDCEIKSFLDKYNILSVETSENTTFNKLRKKPKKRTFLKRIRHKETEDTGKEDTGNTEQGDTGKTEEDRREEGHDNRSEENSTIGDIVQPGNKLAPYDRVNMMTTMEGEFTRKDYQKFMEEKNYRIQDFMGHSDIEDAVLLRKIEPTGEKLGKGLVRYRVIDKRPIEQYMYRKIKRSHKEKRKHRQE